VNKRMIQTLLNSSTLPLVVSSVLTAIVTYLVARHNNKKELMITDRQQISQENQQIRQELRQEMDKLREELHVWRNRCMELETIVQEWRDKYTTLVVERQQLEYRVKELETELKTYMQARIS
jgi:sensor domain CHASE-containing protein